MWKIVLWSPVAAQFRHLFLTGKSSNQSTPLQIVTGTLTEMSRRRRWRYVTFLESTVVVYTWCAVLRQQLVSPYQPNRMTAKFSIWKTGMKLSSNRGIGRFQLANWPMSRQLNGRCPASVIGMIYQDQVDDVVLRQKSIQIRCLSAVRVWTMRIQNWLWNG